MRNMYYGQETTVKGIINIKLPEWWTALNGEDKTEYNYQFTPIGSWCELYVSKEIENNEFEVSTSDGSDCKFSWTVSAIRHDKLIEENPLIVEEYK